MKKIKQIYNFLLQHKMISAFVFSFVIFFILGMLLSYYNVLDINFYFEADNARAFDDFAKIKDASHYRIKVHPLMLILFQPLVLLLKGIVHDPYLTVIILQSIFGATAVCLMIKLLSYFKVERVIKLLLIIIFMFSFSTILFTTIPETFFFAGVSIMAYWLYLFYLIDKDVEIKLSQIIILCFFGILCFGITLTNYVTYIIGLLYLVWNKYRNNLKNGVTILLKINILNFLIIIILALIQAIVWQNSPLFWNSLKMVVVDSTQFEETLYMDFTISLSKTMTWIKQLFICSFITTKPYIISNEMLQNIHFGGVNLFTALFTISFYSVFIVGLMNGIKKVKLLNSRMIFMVIALLFNMILHYIYGYKNSFMYSPHFLFFIVLILAELLQGIRNSNLKRFIIILLTFATGILIVNNIGMFIYLITIVREYLGTSFSIIGTAIKSLIVCVMVFSGMFFLAFYVKKLNIIRFRHLTVESKINVMLVVYLFIVCVSCICIKFNYWRL